MNNIIPAVATISLLLPIVSTGAPTISVSALTGCDSQMSLAMTCFPSTPDNAFGEPRSLDTISFRRMPAAPAGAFDATRTSIPAVTEWSPNGFEIDGLFALAKAPRAGAMVRRSTARFIRGLGAGIHSSIVPRAVSSGVESASAPQNHDVVLTWTASTSVNAVGYYVYRGSTSGGPYSRLNSSIVTSTTYTDSTAQAGQTYYYVATTVDTNNIESSYSNESQVAVPGLTAPSFTVSPSSGTGLSQNFTFSFSGANFGQTHMLISSSFDAANACYLIYWPASGGLYLAADGGSQLVGPVSPGGGGTLSNSQCSVAASGISVSGSGGTNLTISVPVLFTPAFAGAKNTYLAAFDTSWNRYDWVTAGSWMVSGGGSAFAVAPTSGSGSAQNFTFSFSGANFGQTHMLISSSVGTANACYLLYWPAYGGLYLLADNGAQLIGPVAPGGSGSLSNSQCSVAGSGVSVSASGTNLVIAMPVLFKQAFAGAKNTYLAAYDTSWNRYDWVTAGTWMVSSGSGFTATPVSGSGSSQNFTFSFSGANFGQVHILINSALTGVVGCYLMYQANNNGLYLLDDAGGQLLGPLAPGGGGILSNRQCSIPASNVTVSASGTNLIVTAPISFTSAFDGSKSIFLAGFDTSSNRFGWVTVGGWTVSH
jgi:hypothetical protein